MHLIWASLLLHVASEHQVILKIYKSKIKSRKKCKKYLYSFCIAHFWLNLKQCVYLEAFLSRSSIFCSLSSSDAFSYNCRATKWFFSYSLLWWGKQQARLENILEQNEKFYLVIKYINFMLEKNSVPVLEISYQGPNHLLFWWQIFQNTIQFPWIFFGENATVCKKQGTRQEEYT